MKLNMRYARPGLHGIDGSVQTLGKKPFWTLTRYLGVLILPKLAFSNVRRPPIFYDSSEQAKYSNFVIGNIKYG